MENIMMKTPIEVEQALQSYADLFLKICNERGWKRNWSNGGCYLHLEVSEFIEALRGKGDPEDEAGDIFFVFLAMLSEHKISITEAFRKIIDKLQHIDEHPNIVDITIKHTKSED